MKMYTQRGFTIIELMITVLLLGVMLTIAVPSFSAIFKQNRLAAQTNTILSSLNYARGETINQNTNVVLAPITAGTNWSAGWTTSVNGTVLRNFEGFENAALTSSQATISYRANGTILPPPLPATNITLTVIPTDCPTGNSDIRVITIALSGQATSATGVCP
jgi:type IV fimbrial biogenesis protein FimT